MVNSPARPLSKFMFWRSIHGDGITSVSIVLHVDAENPGAVLVDEDVPDSLVLVVVPGAVSVRRSAACVDEILVVLLVLIMSGSVRRRRFRGFQPRSLIAILFVLFRPNDSGQIRLIKGKISLFQYLNLIPFVF